MRLNNDCIREILLYIEENTTYTKSAINVDNLVNNLNYDEETIFYHVSLISQANLVDRVTFADNRPFFISKLSWEGHQYIDNIRDTKAWTFIKSKTEKLSSISLSLLIQLAPELIKQYLLQ